MVLLQCRPHPLASRHGGANLTCLCSETYWRKAASHSATNSVALIESNQLMLIECQRPPGCPVRCYCQRLSTGPKRPEGTQHARTNCTNSWFSPIVRPATRPGMTQIRGKSEAALNLPSRLHELLMRRCSRQRAYTRLTTDMDICNYFHFRTSRTQHNSTCPFTFIPGDTTLHQWNALAARHILNYAHNHHDKGTTRIHRCRLTGIRTINPKRSHNPLDKCKRIFSYAARSRVHPLYQYPFLNYPEQHTTNTQHIVPHIHHI